MRYFRFPVFLVTFFICLLMSCGGGDDSSPGGGGSGGPGNGGSGNLNNGSVGSSANDLLSADSYRTLEIEIQYAAGFRPPQESVDFLESFIEDLVNKPGGVNVTLAEISTPGQDTYSLAELSNIEENNRTRFTRDDVIATYFFFADGDYEPNANVLGIAYRNTSMVLFQKRIEELSGGLTQASTELVTSAVLAHEFGHILGLVNIGSPPQSDHQDEANGAHCDVRECLMYFSINTAGGLDDLIGLNTPPDLDPQCKADLTANGGR